MFGYVKTASGELKVKEYELYKAVYCGLCRALKGRIKCFSELTLSYDFVFLALLAISWNKEDIVICSKRCIAHPFKKRPMLELSPTLETTASLSAVLTHYKILDDFHDGSLLKKIAASSILPFTYSMKKRAFANVKEELESGIKKQLSCILELEKNNCSSPDEIAQVFGNLLGDIFAASVYGEREKRLARECGIGTGRWIYLVDAIDDYSDDIKKSRYNPFYKSSPDNIDLKTALMLELKRIETAVMLTDFSDEGIKNIVYNIIYIGMPDTAEKAIEKSCGCITDNKEK